MKKRILSISLAMLIVFTLIPTVALAANPSFADVPDEHWAHDVISRWSGAGVLAGNDDGTFSPSRGLTLGELAAILSRTFGYTEREAATVSPAWAAEYVEKAIAAGVITQAATIDAGVTLTREQAVRLIVIAYAIEPVAGNTVFADDVLIGASYRPYVNAFQRLGLIAGYNNQFDPQGSFTRAAAMMVLDNMTSAIVDESVSGEVFARDLIVRTAGVTIENTVVSGDLIVAHGVGDGEVTLDNVTVSGRLVLFGGGDSSIHITGGSQISVLVANKRGGAPVNISLSEDSTITGGVQIAEGSHARISGNVDVEIRVAANVRLELAEGTVVTNIVVVGERVMIYISEGATSYRITIDGDDVLVHGRGQVDAVVVYGGQGVQVLTSGTQITNLGRHPVEGEGGMVDPLEPQDAPADENGEEPQVTNGMQGQAVHHPPYWGYGWAQQPGAGPGMAVATCIVSLQDLIDSGYSVIHINSDITAEQFELVIPSGVVLVLNNAGLRVWSLTVNGTILSGSEYAWLSVVSPDRVQGAGFLGYNFYNFFGLDVGYHVGGMEWLTSELHGVPYTGWWPSMVFVTDEYELREAMEIGTVWNMVLTSSGEFNYTVGVAIQTFHITSNIDVHRLNIGLAHVIIDENVTVSVEELGMWAWPRSQLTVNGTLVGDRITIANDGSVLVLNGERFYGPAANRFVGFHINNAVRVLDWEDGGWGRPRLINMETGQENVWVNLNTLDDIGFLEDFFPDLYAVHIYGGGQRLSSPYYNWTRISFSEDFAFTTTDFAFWIHGNRILGYGDDAWFHEPVRVEAGVTVTIASGVEVIFLSDGENLLAVVGPDYQTLVGTTGDTAAVIRIEEGATVESWVNYEVVRVWEVGDHTWCPYHKAWRHPALEYSVWPFSPDNPNWWMPDGFEDSRWQWWVDMGFVTPIG
ncbi:MAG: S-layer homology domain-containing protein [Oscillospiraceae bacterium]|nr:S-layer homology domain-containing protein [Oscillospiraceae bacterium]